MKTEVGSYAWALGSGQPALSLARIISPDFVTEGAGRRCMIFFYLMHGATVESLYINVINAASGLPTTVWSRTHDQGTGWQKVRFRYLSVGAINLSC